MPFFGDTVGFWNVLSMIFDDTLASFSVGRLQSGCPVCGGLGRKSVFGDLLDLFIWKFMRFMRFMSPGSCLMLQPHATMFQTNANQRCWSCCLSWRGMGFLWSPCHEVLLCTCICRPKERLWSVRTKLNAWIVELARAKVQIGHWRTSLIECWRYTAIDWHAFGICVKYVTWDGHYIIEMR
jgi:hypothetical protein